MSPKPLPLTGLITPAVANASGWSRRQVAEAITDGRLVVVRRGVAVDAATWADQDFNGRHVLRLRAQLLVVPDRWHAARRSAAVLAGLPILGRPPAQPQLVADRGAGTAHSSTRHQRLVRLRPDERAVLAGTRTTALPRLAADLAREESFRGAVVAVDGALRRGLTGAALCDALADMEHWPGIEQAREVARFADGRAESPLESISRVALRNARLPTPELQVEIRCGSVFLARVDFLWAELGVFGEADGAAKYGRAVDLLLEKRRQETMEDLGLIGVRWGWDDAWRRGGELGDRVRRALDRGERSAVDPRLRFVRT